MPSLMTWVGCTFCAEAGMGMLTPTVRLPLSDSDFYRWTCPNGHEYGLAMQNNRFEVLMEIGARALVDGYPRECVTSFHAALERFYEFALLVLVQDDSAPGLAERFAAADLVLAQLRRSEQQLGAFVLAWALTFKETAPQLTNKLVHFRNDVVHGGMIPSYEAALNYAQAVFTLVGQAAGQICAGREERVAAVAQRQLNTARQDAGWTGARNGTIHVATIFSVANAANDLDLAAHVETLRSRPAGL